MRADAAAKPGSVPGPPAKRVGLSPAIGSARTRGLVEGRSGVAAVGVPGQRGIGEVQDVAQPPSQFRALEAPVSRPAT